MLRLVAIPVAVLSVAAAEEPAPDDIAGLVVKLGSEDFAEREAATRRLAELGTAAIDQLRAATRSDNAEAARRAVGLLRKAERKLASEKTLAPTLVELDAKDRPLDEVLAVLSEEAKYDVVLGGVKTANLAAKKVTVATGGKVPFWSAVLAVCAAGDLRIASAGGFLAPGAMPPPRDRAGAGVRTARNVNQAVVLEARGDAPPRPAAVKGAVLIEAVPIPKVAAPKGPAVLLQAWPEPRLRWDGTADLKVTRALAAGEKLAAEYVPMPKGNVVGKREGMVLIQNPDGSATWSRDTAAFEVAGTLRPNARQALLRIKPGEKPVEVADELGVSLFAHVRSGVEPLAHARGLEPNKQVAGASSAGVELTVTYRKNGAGRLVASVELSFDKAVQYAGVSDELPGAPGGAGAAVGNHTVHGIRIADADGKPYTLGLASGANQFDPTGKRVVMKLQLELHTNRDGQGPPASATFWGTAVRGVEIPVTLRDVPLTSR
jgi:hypothetical protein